MIVLKPKGRGNWTTVLMALDGVRVSPLLIRAGHTFTLGGVVWRICEVRM